MLRTIPRLTDLCINNSYKRSYSTNINDLYEGLVNKNRISLSKSITLVESTRPEDRKKSRELISKCLSNKHAKKSRRLGFTGTPGVGKSTFIEAFGKTLVDRGHKLAVLAVDPSSSRSGGSILGDKTRMPYLSVHENAFVRPSPNRGSMGGVSKNTLETIVLCEAAGYDTCFVETVGVGQSEFIVSEMVDM
ncbi:Methylmalonic aciduria type A protein, mitochondrial [Smittium culicis]|uniref:Methylmalonic aciduria type A protein, mitochondrial n=1 Tax=Smittium culicis TaxID=133412 RepID=A0A1R1WXN6_9FUNG|nr:Methylmalonic aciduria type A protein, mitochondrial [Smittium culicis]